MNAAARAGEQGRPVRHHARGRGDAPSGQAGGAVNLAARAAELAGLNLKAVGEAAMLAALDKASAGCGLDAARFLNLAVHDPGKRRVLAGEAVVQESWLFREAEAFAALKKLAPTLSRPVRALCVPCAGGEEPVSMALTFLDAGLAPDEFLIDAADVSESALASARAGVFGPPSVRSGMDAVLSRYTRAQGDPALAVPGNPPARLFPREGMDPDAEVAALAESRRFTRAGQDLVLDPEVSARIRYLAGDVLDGEFLAQEPPYQIIFCRHLLIYLSAGGRERLAATLRRLLARTGLLFAATAEAAALLGLGFSLRGGLGGAPVLTPDLPPDLTPCLTPGPARTARLGSVPRAPAHGAFVPAVHGTAARQGLDTPPAPSRILEDARALAGAGRLEDALSMVERALGLDEPGPDLFALKGAALLALGRQDEAEAAFRRALYLDPCHVEALGHLELLASAQGRAEEASRLAARLKRAQTSGETP